MNVRKWSILALLLAVLAILSACSPRETAWQATDAEPVAVSQWPENDFTAQIFPPQGGEIDSVLRLLRLAPLCPVLPQPIHRGCRGICGRAQSRRFCGNHLGSQRCLRRCDAPKRRYNAKHRLFSGHIDRADRFARLKTDAKRRALLLSEPRPANSMDLKILRE